MIKKYSLFVALMLFTIISNAQNIIPKNVFLKKLPNGLDVMVVEDHSVPLVTLLMNFKAGAFTESETNNGLTAMYQLMLFKGNKDYESEQSLNYHSGDFGIGLRNTGTTLEYSNCYFTLPKANFVKGLNFMNSAVRYAKLDPEELEKLKEVIKVETKRKQSVATYALFETMDRHLWGSFYSRKNGRGNTDVMNAATQQQLLAVKNKYYYPNNAILIIGGDIEHDFAFSEAEKMYGDWVPAELDPIVEYPVPQIKPLDKTDYFIVESNLTTEPTLGFVWHGPATRNDIASTYAADVFTYLINLNSSKLNKALVQSGLASSIRISYPTLKYTGPITLMVIPNPLKIKECVAEIKKQINLMDGDDYLSANQIETAKLTLDIKQTRTEDITTDYVHSLSFWWSSVSFDYFWGYSNNLKKVSQADMKAFVQKYIKSKPYCAGLLISPELSAEINAPSFFKSN
ncbi:MAG: pitrilysin family protein [Mucilaginibacter sp.]|uniref:M16 family metallopeptidase n=1 Tax=Mucilaginibacter sp. TaxID=1882438 RepID=UPI0032675321